MLKTYIATITYFNRAIDILINFLCFLSAYFIHEHFFVGLITQKTIISPFHYLQLFLICILLVNIVGTNNDFYGYDRFYDSQVIVRKWLSTYIQAFAYTMLIFYVFERYVPSRSMVMIYFTATLVFSLIFRYIERKTLHRLYAKGKYLQNVLVVGTGTEANMVISEINTNGHWGFKLIGVLSRMTEIDVNFKYKEMVRDNIQNLENYLKTNIVDLVIFAINNEEVNSVRSFIFLCEKMGIMTMINLDNFEMKIAKTHVEYLGVIPMITFTTVPIKHRLILIKYALDKIFTFFSLIVFIPFLFIPIAIILKLTSSGPIIFSQERVGLNGRRFKMYKFRTMIENAEDLLEGLRDRSEVDGPTFKMKDDPRITPFGKFLRRFSLDELPQLLNVLKGDMSIVGPRPPIPSEVERYENEFRRRLSMKPGLTCLWQISGRSDVDFKTWMDMDMKYIDAWTLIGDLVIIVKTIPAVFSRKGAY
ncbi:MAG: sugar transferase [Candidatus Margulisbacteria bacterium]|nr:sugar transferase [Candidatus Margulisiibacteriota bacterium]